MGLNGKDVVNLRDLKILDEIREIYHQNTGMVISFHYPERKDLVDFFPKKKKNEFCMIVQSTDEGVRRCLASDRRGFTEAKHNGGYCIYQCHASLTDVSIPLIYEGQELGGMYTGQVLLSDPSDESFDQLYGRLQNLNVNYSELKDAYFKVMVVDRERLHFHVKLLTLIANYIIAVEHEVQLQRVVIKKDRELHHKEKERMKLEKALKDLSISVLELEKGQDHLHGIGSSSLRNHDKIAKAREFIRKNFNKQIHLDDVASAVFLSPNYFSSLFKSMTGRTFSSYLMSLRVQAARELLTRTAIPIKEVVYQVGFDDYNYFNRTFRKITGMPPARFRHLNGLPRV